MFGLKKTSQEKNIDKAYATKENEGAANKEQKPINSVSNTKSVRRGRPARQGELKTKKVVLYLTESEYIILRSKASAIGLNPTSFVVSQLIYKQ